MKLDIFITKLIFLLIKLIILTRVDIECAYSMPLVYPLLFVLADRYFDYSDVSM